MYFDSIYSSFKLPLPRIMSPTQLHVLLLFIYFFVYPWSLIATHMHMDLWPSTGILEPTHGCTPMEKTTLPSPAATNGH